ncbi:hypothetical protein [Carboxylicivirga sp. N1Y90]|uniref:hypothetical protein n=1 Tax=Carboxylicivirga fragile TaxID=3417571 RepID=UPI003D34D99C|nr:hypothetical protein [Marinilabiliaceae bacterium N1Y90]
MRKFSSHYALSDDGTWMKRPIIEVDDEGCILSIRETGNAFKEEPGLEYFPGVIIPAFVRFVKKEDFSETKLKRFIIAGVRRLVFDNKPQFIIPPSVSWEIKQFKEEVVLSDPWENINANTKEGLSLAEALLKESKELAQSVNVFPEWGSINVGAKPGLLLLKGVDLKTFTLTDKLSIRVLVD